MQQYVAACMRFLQAAASYTYIHTHNKQTLLTPPASTHQLPGLLQQGLLVPQLLLQQLQPGALCCKGPVGLNHLAQGRGACPCMQAAYGAVGLFGITRSLMKHGWQF
jgi:hypothetical protein